MNFPKFSIITVTYNAGEWLERTILSVLSQSYSDIEYLIIDGGSTDKTIDVIKQYEPSISYWISEPDKGLYDAMNKGLQKVTDGYVLFLNAGDTLYTLNTIKQIAGQITGKKVLPDIIYGETMIVDKNNEPKGLRRLRAPEKLTWKSFRMGMMVCHQSFIIKREIAPLYNPDYKWVADYDWCIQGLKEAKYICNTHQVISNFMEEGLSSVNRKASLKERYTVMTNYYGRLSTMFLHAWFAVRFYYAKWIKKRI